MSTSNRSNTLILTDNELLHPDNRSILNKTIDALKEFIESLNKLHGIHSCLQILHLRSLGRILLIFSNSEFAQLIYNYLHSLEIRVGFSRNDNAINDCNLYQHCGTMIQQMSSSKLTVNENTDMPINERLPQNQVTEKLEPPNPPIQMQSPPPSPYEGWVNQPEEAPSETTIGYHPKKLSHLLYTIDPVTKEQRRVFSSYIDADLFSDTKEDELQHLDLGEPLNEGESENNLGILEGSLFQKSSLNKEAEVPRKKKLDMKIPIVIIDHDEAQNIKKQAQSFETTS